MLTIPDALLPADLLLAEHAVHRYVVAVKMGTTLEMVLDPGFWVNVIGPARLGYREKLAVNDEVRVICDDGSFDVELTVVGRDPRGLWAQTRMLRGGYATTVPAAGMERAAPDGIELPDPDGYRIELSGPQGWRIVDRAGHVVDKRLHSREAAGARLAQFKAEKAATPASRAVATAA